MIVMASRKEIVIALFLALPLLTAAMKNEMEQGFFPEPSTESGGPRDKLSESHSAIWTELSRCNVKYNDDSLTFSIIDTPAVMALRGTIVTVSGFVLPLDGTSYTKHFLLMRRTPFGVRFAPSEPNEIIEIMMGRHIAWTKDMTTVSGSLSLINNAEKGIFFEITNASVKRAAPQK